MKKLSSIKSLEAKVWLLCKSIIRLKYPHSCVTCGQKIEGKRLHTGHFFRKKYLPLQMKYDLRLLRPQCPNCNMRMHGNEAWYSVYLINQHGGDYVISIANDINAFKEQPLNTPKSRDYLTKLITQYKDILSYPQI